MQENPHVVDARKHVARWKNWAGQYRRTTHLLGVYEAPSDRRSARIVMLTHQWRVWWSQRNVVICDRCGIMAFTNNRDGYKAARSHGPVLVGQIVPEDCEQVMLQMVHES